MSFPIPERSLGAFAAFLDARGLPYRFLPETEPFPWLLRLVVSSRCLRGCHHPDGSAVWCHAEGITNPQTTFPLEEMRNAAAFLRNRYDLKRARIAGLEPRFDETFPQFVRGLHRAGFEQIGLTTHDESLLPHLEAYRDAGLTQVTVSIPHSDDAEFGRMAYTGRASALFDLVLRAKELGLTALEVNRVLQKGTTDDLPELLRWAREHDVTVKLFELMWTPSASSTALSRYFVSWFDFVDLWLDDTEEATLRHYAQSRRTRVRFGLRGGGGVEVNLMCDKRQAAAETCRSCSWSTVCAEGYLGCGIRLLPDLTVLPCLLRPELGIDAAGIRRPVSPSSLHDDLDLVIEGRRRPTTEPHVTRYVSVRGTGEEGQ